jgi:hypothetical protein
LSNDIFVDSESLPTKFQYQIYVILEGNIHLNLILETCKKCFFGEFYIIHGNIIKIDSVLYKNKDYKSISRVINAASIHAYCVEDIVLIKMLYSENIWTKHHSEKWIPNWGVIQ